jgi:hypothetical protein
VTFPATPAGAECIDYVNKKILIYSTQQRAHTVTFAGTYINNGAATTITFPTNNANAWVRLYFVSPTNAIILGSANVTLA